MFTSLWKMGKCLKTIALGNAASIAVTMGAAKFGSLVAFMLFAKHIVKMTSTVQQRKALMMLTGFPSLICLSMFSLTLFN